MRRCSLSKEPRSSSGEEWQIFVKQNLYDISFTFYTSNISKHHTIISL